MQNAKYKIYGSVLLIWIKKYIMNAHRTIRYPGGGGAKFGVRIFCRFYTLLCIYWVCFYFFFHQLDKGVFYSSGGWSFFFSKTSMPSPFLDIKWYILVQVNYMNGAFNVYGDGVTLWDQIFIGQHHTRIMCTIYTWRLLRLFEDISAFYPLNTTGNGL